MKNEKMKEKMWTKLIAKITLKNGFKTDENYEDDEEKRNYDTNKIQNNFWTRMRINLTTLFDTLIHKHQRVKKNGPFKLILNFLIYLSWNMDDDSKQNQTKIPWKGINK